MPSIAQKQQRNSDAGGRIRLLMPRSKRSKWSDWAQLAEMDHSVRTFEGVGFYHQATARDGLVDQFQLSSGLFTGQSLVVETETVTFYLEYTDQFIERQIRNDAHSFLFTLVLDFDSSDWCTNERMRPRRRLGVYAPGSEFVRFLEPGITILTAKVNADWFMKITEKYTQISDYFDNLSGRSIVVDSLWMADRLRGDVIRLQDAIFDAKQSNEHRNLIARIFMCDLAVGFELENLRQGHITSLPLLPSSERFYDARALIHSQKLGIDRRSLEAPFSRIGSRRAIEKAFKTRVGMGPFAYARLVRLHNTQQKIMQRDRLTQSIGDIAAEDGFFEWSKFSHYYRKQFGELPSQTRKRLLI